MSVVATTASSFLYRSISVPNGQSFSMGALAKITTYGSSTVVLILEDGGSNWAGIRASAGGIRAEIWDATGSSFVIQPTLLSSGFADWFWVFLASDGSKTYTFCQPVGAPSVSTNQPFATTFTLAAEFVIGSSFLIPPNMPTPDGAVEFAWVGFWDRALQLQEFMAQTSRTSVVRPDCCVFWNECENYPNVKQSRIHRVESGGGDGANTGQPLANSGTPTTATDPEVAALFEPYSSRSVRSRFLSTGTAPPPGQKRRDGIKVTLRAGISF